MSECFICELPLEAGGPPVSTVKEKGILSFLDASKKRKDGKARGLQGKTTVIVHDKCRKSYTDERSIAAYLKRREEIAVAQRTSRSATTDFAFRTHCFICGLEISKKFMELQAKKPVNERDVVYQVRDTTGSLRRSIMKDAADLDDEYGQAVIRRIQNVPDLVAYDAQYHQKCRLLLTVRVKRTNPVGPVKKRGPYASQIDAAMNDIYSYLENNDDECQFSLDELMEQIKGDYIPEPKTVKANLLEKYKYDVLFSTSKRKKTVVCFKNVGEKLLNDAWYKEKCKSEAEERLRVVEAAAKIICEDIRSQVYNVKEYPAPDRFVEEVEAVIPESLTHFMNTLIVMRKKGENTEKWKRKCQALSHSIISGVRPRSFLSPLQVGTATFLYKKFGSRRLIDVLNAMGFCSSYTEAVRFEVSSTLNAKEKPSCSDAFIQFIYDNADFNTQTLDGYNTFHVMGGVSTTAPASSVPPDSQIERLARIPTAEAVGRFGHIMLKRFVAKAGVDGLKSIKIEDLTHKFGASPSTFPSAAEILWLFGKYKGIVPGWNAFMEQATNGLTYERSYTECLPFINAPPSDYDTIYTSLLESARKCKANKQKWCLVTFDQPLYFKARFIVANCDDPMLENVVIRLGGFHLLMSFLGALCYPMNGSGWKDLVHSSYAMNTIDKIMTGHAYYRAVRAHILVHAALMKIVMNMIELSSDSAAELEQIIYDFDTAVILSVDPPECREIRQKVYDQLERLKQPPYGPTSKLWVQYIEMVNLMKLFIFAERTGNWELHLEVVWKMLPYFHSSGHFHYAKSAHLYLQDMIHLKETMSPHEYNQFTKEGYFTVRRKASKFWSGTWTDMVIEQFLMRSMKVSGGLTHGRGVREGIQFRWTRSMTAGQHVCEQIEDFCGVSFEDSEQHHGLTDTRVVRDNKDCAKMYQWLQDHFPFSKNPILFSLSTGVAADSRVDCHEAWEKGMKGIKRVVEHFNFGNVKFQRADRVQPLAIMNNAVKVDKDVFTINPTTLFQRISVAKNSDAELEQFLSYDLGPYSCSLFDNGLLRKGTKSKLYNSFIPLKEQTMQGKVLYVIDGGFLLHKVTWPDQKTFSEICDAYVNYVKTQYGSKTLVVFDGYPPYAQGGTKSSERLKRSLKSTSTDILFDETMIPTTTKEKFLRNSNNKKRLISMITNKMTTQNMCWKQATEDADAMIVAEALILAESEDNVIIVGEDVDLLVILIGLCKRDNVFFLKPGRDRNPPTTYAPRVAVENKTIADNILFLHAMSGCDTTSAPYNQGKGKFVKAISKNPGLGDVVSAFKNSQATPQAIAAAGERFLVEVYGYHGKKTPSINKLRFLNYKKAAFKASSKIDALPPSAGSAAQHSYRVYHQVQQWMGVKKPAEDWGWDRTSNGLEPIPTLDAPAPPELLKLVTCKCTKTCARNCSCMKAGLRCSELCVNCLDNSCSNSAVTSSIDEESEAEDLGLDFEEATVAVEGELLDDEEMEEEEASWSEGGPRKKSRRLAPPPEHF